MNPIHNNSIIMKNCVYKKYGLYFDSRYKHAEDYKFWLEVSRLGKLANYPESLVYYRLHSTQTSSLHNYEQGQIAKKIRKEAMNYYLTDLGIKFKLGKEIHFYDVNFIHHSLVEKEKSQELTNRILYDLYFSLCSYSIRDLFYFFLNKNYKIFTLKQRIKIVKKYLRPWKYTSKI